MSLLQHPIFVLDTNVLIEAHRRYYSLDLCPGFWECLIHFCGESRVRSIDRVRKEIREGDGLDAWVKQAPSGFFASTADREVINCFQEIMSWIQSSDQYKPEARSSFANIADGWVVAYARAYDGIVVSHEAYRPNRKSSIPIPNICRQFSVPYEDTFSMLRALEVRFNWTR